MNLESDTIGEDEEIRMARETLPEPSRTTSRCIVVPIMPKLPVSAVLKEFIPDPGFTDVRRIEFIKVLASIGDTSFDAWASGVDGKVYL